MSIFHVALMSQFIILLPQGQKEIGNQVSHSLPVFITGAGSIGEGGMNFVIFLFTFLGTLPKKLIGNGEETQLFGTNNS